MDNLIAIRRKKCDGNKVNLFSIVGKNWPHMKKWPLFSTKNIWHFVALMLTKLISIAMLAKWNRMFRSHFVVRLSGAGLSDCRLIDFVEWNDANRNYKYYDFVEMIFLNSWIINQLLRFHISRMICYCWGAPICRSNYVSVCSVNSFQNRKSIPFVCI